MFWILAAEITVVTARLGREAFLATPYTARASLQGIFTGPKEADSQTQRINATTLQYSTTAILSLETRYEGSRQASLYVYIYFL